MAIMPNVDYRPLQLHGGRMSRYDITCLHTMVGSLWGTDSYFQSGKANSHFGVGGDGYIIQWLDTSIQSWANLNGNDHIITIENADMGPEFPKWNTNDGSAVPSFPPAQIEANAKILAWVSKTHGTPLDLIPDSKRGRRGTGYHRLGVPGYMVAGGEKWSNATGKVCPGNRRIAQIPQIIGRAQQILNPNLEDDMPLNDADKAWIKAEIVNRQVGYGNRIENTEAIVGIIQDRQVGYGNRIENIEAMVAKLLDGTTPAS